MAEQKAKARAAWAGSGEAADEAIWFDLAERHGPTEFLGYDTETAEGQILALVVGGHPVETARDRRRGAGRAEPDARSTPSPAARSATPARSAPTRRRVDDHRRAQEGRPLRPPRAASRRASSSAARRRSSSVDHDRRSAIRANHSATHLLHEALRRALGDHVAQRGSLVAPDRLRFDFTHAKAMTPGGARRGRGRGQRLRPAEHAGRDPDHDAGRRARSSGARALFGEKYGDEVRVVSMGSRAGSGLGQGGDTYSLELCGGTHVARTGDIGAFKLVSEGASATRRAPDRGADRRRRARARRRRRGGARRGGGAAARAARGARPSASARSSTSARRRRSEIAELRRRLAHGRRPGGGEGAGDRRRRAVPRADA